MLLDRRACQERLQLVFPASAVDDPVVAGPLAGAAVFVCLYVGAIDGENPIRPSTVLWMSDDVARRSEPEFRRRWGEAAKRGRRAVEELEAREGLRAARWYAENSRETLRDEVWRGWRQYGAIERDARVPTTSSRPTWTLTRDFAELFDPTLRGAGLARRVTAWQETHLGRVPLARQALLDRRREAREGLDVAVRGQVRRLRPGDSSLLIQGVVEQFAPRVLAEPEVLMISESADKVDAGDEELMRSVGLEIDEETLLPDAILMETGRRDGRFWFIEVVASDGEVHTGRRDELLAWASRYGIQEERCRFLTAFLARTDPAWRRRAPRIALDTYVWFLSEPDLLLRFERLP